MREVSAWQSDDGRLFETKAACATHEFRVKHGDAIGEQALNMILMRPKEIAELLAIIADDDGSRITADPMTAALARSVPRIA